jgi:hypothetical protein
MYKFIPLLSIPLVIACPEVPESSHSLLLINFQALGSLSTYDFSKLLDHLCSVVVDRDDRFFFIDNFCLGFGLDLNPVEGLPQILAGYISQGKGGDPLRQTIAALMVDLPAGVDLVRQENYAPTRALRLSEALERTRDRVLKLTQRGQVKNLIHLITESNVDVLGENYRMSIYVYGLDPNRPHPLLCPLLSLHSLDDKLEEISKVSNFYEIYYNLTIGETLNLSMFKKLVDVIPIQDRRESVLRFNDSYETLMANLCTHKDTLSQNIERASGRISYLNQLRSEQLAFIN